MIGHVTEDQTAENEADQISNMRDFLINWITEDVELKNDLLIDRTSRISPTEHSHQLKHCVHIRC